MDFASIRKTQIDAMAGKIPVQNAVTDTELSKRILRDVLIVMKARADVGDYESTFGEQFALGEATSEQSIAAIEQVAQKLHKYGYPTEVWREEDTWFIRTTW